MKIGVFVGRFQTPELHNGYKYVLSELQINYDYYGLIVCSSDKPNVHNPLDFETRKTMLEEYVYKKPVFIVEYFDRNDDEKWSLELDRTICCLLIEKNIQYSINNIYLTGSRDSFIRHYKGEGRLQTLELELYGNYNSTELRTGINFDYSSVNFILGFTYGWIKKKFGFYLEWLKPKFGYNSNWSRGYIYCK